MRFLIQRVSHASVATDSGPIAAIGPGLLVLCGYAHLDTPATVSRLVDKCLNLRIFEDEQGKMNLAVLDVQREILIVSQFTLYADCHKGRRPGFDRAMSPAGAESLFQVTFDEFRKSGLNVAAGLFGAKMQVELINDGPVTILLDDAELS